jgi:tRNA(fMet)-specific endonuclease VapC
MTGNSVALDTNVAIQLLNDVPAIVAWLNSFDELYLPAAVVGELLYGALNSARSAENVARVDALVLRCKIFVTTSFVSAAYAELRFHLKKMGRPVPENDLWIAATCIERQVPLATDDAHFTGMPNLSVLNLP